jgi:hypothetical protein
MTWESSVPSGYLQQMQARDIEDILGRGSSGGRRDVSVDRDIHVERGGWRLANGGGSAPGWPLSGTRTISTAGPMNVDPGPISARPRRVPVRGAVLYLRPGQWRYGTRPLILRVRRPRPEISLWYGGSWVWVVGDELDESGEVVGRLPVLVHVNAIP